MSKKFFGEVPVKVGDKIEIEISDLAYGGDAIGKYRDFIVFVPYGVPQSKLKVKIEEVKKDFARGIALSVISKSDIYKKPECIFFGICGGCDWMNIKYDEQIKYKTKILNTMFKNIAKIDFKPDGFIKYREPFFYRNRVQYKLLKDQNGIDLGFFKARSHNVVPVNRCLILYPEINEFAGKIKEFLNEFKDEIEIYDEKNQNGYLRHICIRSNEKKELLVTFVVFKNEIKPFILKIAEKIKRQNNVAGFVLNINQEKGNRVFGEREKLIFGKSFITEKVEYEEGCLSFPGLTEKISRYSKLLVKCNDLKGNTVEFETDGLLAIAIQHEFDHLNGVLFIDRMSPVKKLMHTKKLREIKKLQKEKK